MNDDEAVVFDTNVLRSATSLIGLPDFQDPVDPDFIRELQTGPNPSAPVFFEKFLTPATTPSGSSP